MDVFQLLGVVTFNREVLERVIPSGITYSWELQLRWRIRRPHEAEVDGTLSPGMSSKVATDGPFEAVLGKTALSQKTQNLRRLGKAWSEPNFRRRQVSGPAGPGQVAEVNRPPVGPFACDRMEALIPLRVRKSNFHVSYGRTQAEIISGHASEVARFRQRASVHLWVFWESAGKTRRTEF